jgi:phosphoribosylformylglycinamidine synthase I
MTRVPRIGVISFPGTCDDRDALRAVALAGGEPVALWHADADLQACRGVIVPGGFSYGDYLRAGAIARFAPIMREVEAFAAAGGPVLGICNGFQVLCEAGLLPGVLRPNHHGRFVCRDVDLVVQHAGSPWLAGLAPGDVLRIPVKHHDGAWYAPPEDYEGIEAAGQIELRYRENPNGALADVACVTNAAGNVCGLMPHPEHAIDALLGPLGGRPLMAGLVALATAHRAAASVSAQVS